MTRDTSAVIAILFGEPGYLELVDRVLEADMVRIGAPTLAEALVVASSRKGASAERERRPEWATARAWTGLLHWADARP